MRTLGLTCSQKSFTCESTGHTGYTFFEAMESEVGAPLFPLVVEGTDSALQTEAVKEIDSIFPEVLRSRVLEYVQFRNTARMDDLGKVAPMSALVNQV